MENTQQMNAEDLRQRMIAAARTRRPGYGHLIFLGPGGSVSPVLELPVSSMHYYIPSLRYMFGEDLAAGTGFFEDDYAHLRRRSKRARVAATSEAILGLQEVTPREGEQCAVCLQDFRADEKLRAMPCSHAFHQHCISEWLRRSVACPLCRHQLPTEEEDDDEEEQIAS